MVAQKAHVLVEAIREGCLEEKKKDPAHREQSIIIFLISLNVPEDICG